MNKCEHQNCGNRATQNGPKFHFIAAHFHFIPFAMIFTN